MLRTLNKKLRKLENKEGFTLVELIVVIAIIAILAAILIPMLITYIKRANDSVGVSNARNAYSAAGAAFSHISSIPGFTPTMVALQDLTLDGLGGDFQLVEIQCASAATPPAASSTYTENGIFSITVYRSNKNYKYWAFAAGTAPYANTAASHPAGWVEIIPVSSTPSLITRSAAVYS